MFNIRVYGILIKDNTILLVEEPVRNTRVLKFPGGGLEFGEGTIECLKREFREELDINIENINHFYTTDFFVQSFLNPNDQIISIYYTCNGDASKMNYALDKNMVFGWIPIQQLHADMFGLPIDKIIVEKIKRELI